MQVSLNQIEHTARKAARGAGLNWGLAEEAGQAVRFLEQHGLPGINAITIALEAHQKHPVAALGFSMKQNQWQPVEEKQSSLLSGPSIGDWLNLIVDPLIVRNVLSPILVVAYVALVRHQCLKSICLSWQDCRVLVDRNGVKIDGEVDGANALIAGDMKIESMTDEIHENYVPLVRKIGGVNVNESHWGGLEQLAHRTYVEATDASRLAGAGAGLNDND